MIFFQQEYMAWKNYKEVAIFQIFFLFSKKAKDMKQKIY